MFRVWLLLALIGGQPVGAKVQEDPHIHGTSITLRQQSEILFQFQGASRSVEGFALQRSARIGQGASWMPDESAVIRELAEGLYEVSASIDTAALSFYRIIAFEPTGKVLLINEVMSKNSASISDEHGDFSDWIEIFNPGDVAVDLSGYGLSDDDVKPHKWRFPEVWIQPRSFLIVFASGKESISPGGSLHSSFRLSAGGEALALSDSAQQILDSVNLPVLAGDQSFGRIPDGGDEWHVYFKENSSPGRPNVMESLGVFIESPRFSLEGGFFPADASVSVELFASVPAHAIRYTTNGSPPDLDAPLYLESIVLDKTTVIRAATFKGIKSSAEASRTFFVGVKHELPIISLAGNPSHFEFENGFLYGLGPSVLSSRGSVLQNYPFSSSNAWKDRESEVFIEFYEPDQMLGFRMKAGLKIFGGWGSRGYPQKSFALFARAKYGHGKIDYPIFPDKSIAQFETLVLRNSGNDNQSTLQTPVRPPIREFGAVRSYGSYFANGDFTLIRDAMMQQLVADIGLDTQAYRPAVVYLNGEYWGIYNIREKMNEHYVISNHGIDKGQIDLIEGYGSVRAGSDRNYRAMWNYINLRDLTTPQAYQFVNDEMLDIENFIDYHLAVIYFQNFDIGNIKCWRSQTPGGRFRWMVYDQDYGFNLWPPDVYVSAMARDYSDYDNMFRFYTAGTGTNTGWPNSGGRTLLLRRMLTNSEFTEQFITRCADLLNSNFREEKVVETIGRLSAGIRSEISAHLHRWSWPELEKRGFGVPHQREHAPFIIETWEKNLEVLNEFGQQRPAKLRQDCISRFGLKQGLATLNVDVEPSNSGHVQINSLVLGEFPWDGILFADYPVVVRAIPKPGFLFGGWTGAAETVVEVSGKINLMGNEASNITARFVPITTGSKSALKPVFTEIQFHPAPDQESGDWVEIFNSGSDPLSLGGWIFRDGNDEHAFISPDILLAPDGYLVLCQDAERFRRIHPDGVQCVGDFKFGLGNGGDALRLFEPNGTPVIDLSFDDETPWPLDADGTGRTLQLKDRESDPLDSGSWESSDVLGGSPGVENP